VDDVDPSPGSGGSVIRVGSVEGGAWLVPTEFDGASLEPVALDGASLEPTELEGWARLVSSEFGCPVISFVHDKEPAATTASKPASTTERFIASLTKPVASRPTI
jgi:hypothetical protein